ncbi:MAG: ThuA domain-containing protein [Pseudomonadota bacterium]
MKSLLVLSGGHPYEAEPFGQLIRSLGDWEVSHLIHPDAEVAVGDGAADEADALLFYDMGGYTFADGTVTSRPPTESFKDAIRRRFEAGKGAVAMHHALAGWADWPEWHDWLGGRFLYQAGKHAGAEWPDSGYRHDVQYTARPISGHPVTDHVPGSFPVCDELYLCPMDESSFMPLIRAEGPNFTQDYFYSAAHAVAGAMFSNDGWDHPDGSNCVAWERIIGTAPFIYLQFGDGPDTYANPHVRTIIANALNYTAGR